jgi:hypothetical protein
MSFEADRRAVTQSYAGRSSSKRKNTAFVNRKQIVYTAKGSRR